jgi:iron complex outermembrane recepter protein
MYRVRWYIFFAVLLNLSISAWANDSAHILGVLKDQKEGVLPGGVIQLKNLDSGFTLSAVTDREGRFEFNTLAAGRYKITASAPGFETSVRENVVAIDGRDEIVNFSLNIIPKATVVVVTAPNMIRPLVTETDPRAPRQPIPAHDGADYLKNIPGFSVIRKGGTDGDPVFRGMAGSRLGILLDGQQILGGCGGRMDPPTAYVFPAAYKRITVMKGPQTMLYGPNNSAGTVLFERDMPRAEKAGITWNSSLILGSYDRHDEMFDARATLPNSYIQAVMTRSHSGDYQDGNGASVHSFYTRWSGNAALGWTPGRNTFLEVSLARSNGRAAYADRTMDGTEFARDNLAVKLDKRRVSSLVERIEAQSYYNYIDHVMDNFSWRTPGAAYSVNNPDRKTFGGRVAITLAVNIPTRVVVGADTQHNAHKFRSAMNEKSGDLAIAKYLSASRLLDMRFRQIGLFGEVTRDLAQHNRLIGGFRLDRQKAEDSRMCVNTSMCSGASPLKNDTLGATDRKTLKSGFGRYELDIRGGAGTFYAGVGHVERFPDYWERLKQNPITLKSAFLSAKPEKTTQLDLGMLWRSNAWSGSVSGYYGKIHDYILMRWSPTPVLTRNINATTMGTEAEISYKITASLKADATFAYVRGDNDTDHKPLAQQPPLETRFGMNYDNRSYSFGALARLAGLQNRIDIGSGSIVANGMDIGPTAGFAVFSLNGGYRLKKLLIAGGIDNLLGRAYAEHISRGGAMVPGFVQMARINEPGRTFWLKANFNVD